MKLFYYKDGKAHNTLLKLKRCNLSIVQFYRLEKILEFCFAVSKRIDFHVSELFSKYGVEKIVNGTNFRYEYSNLDENTKIEINEELRCFFESEEQIPSENRFSVKISKLETLGDLTQDEFDILKNCIDLEE